MIPIHEMKTRKATWKEPNGPTFVGDVQCHGVFFEVDGREVGVVIQHQSEAVAKPLIEAIAALPEMVGALQQVKEWIEVESEPERYPTYDALCAVLRKAGIP